MADPNDDLLEDGDITDGNFELDLADEDALLADDYDEKPMKSLRSTDIGRSQTMEDEDFIEIGVDEDLALADDAKNENDSCKSTRKAIVFDDSNNDDSDEGGKERSRFKTERNINAVPRPTSSIPETLDAVAVKSQPTIGYNNHRGGRGGGIIAKRGFRGGIRGGFQRGGGIPRFRPPHPQQFGPIVPVQMMHKDMGQMQPHYPHPQFSQMVVDQYNNSTEDCYQTPPAMPQPTYHSNPVVQPPATNIHVNRHFRGPRPQVNHNLTMWNGPGYQGNQNLQQNYQPAQPPYQNHYQPAQTQQWSENSNLNEYYPSQNSSAPPNNYVHEEQYYNGTNTGVDQYYHQSPQPNYQQSVAGTSMGPNIAPQQMNWNDGSNYYAGPQNAPVPAPPMDMYNNMQQMNPPMHQNTYNNHNRPPHQPQMQLQHKKMFIQNKKIQQFKNNKFQPVGKGRGGKLMLHMMNMKKEQIQNKVTPTKPARIETGALRKIQITNLHEVPVTNMTTPQKKNIPEPEEEDEEMKAYRKKIEEQKKLREQVLKQKEEKRKVAAQQKFQMLAAKKKNAEEQAAAAANATVQNANANQQLKIVRVRLHDGRTVIKKLSPAQISKLKKISSGTRPPPQVKNEAALPKSRIVVVDNLSASTTQKQLENMAKQMGKVERVKLNAETKRATVIFENTMSASAFVQKFQRKMVDLSMISLRMVMNADDINPPTSSTITTSINSGNIANNGTGGIVTNIAAASSSTATTTTAATTPQNVLKQQQQLQQNNKPSYPTKPMHI